jgi:hypothetical protein
MLQNVREGGSLNLQSIISNPCSPLKEKSPKGKDHFCCILNKEILSVSLRNSTRRGLSKKITSYYLAVCPYIQGIQPDIALKGYL